jgi:hypothetical protein
MFLIKGLPIPGTLKDPGCGYGTCTLAVISSEGRLKSMPFVKRFI